MKILIICLFVLLTVLLMPLLSNAQDNNAWLVIYWGHDITSGGYGFNTPIGANKGDKFHLIVNCLKDSNNLCLDGTPVLEDDVHLNTKKFILDIIHSYRFHQEYNIVAPYTGEHFVKFQYYWVGLRYYNIYLSVKEKFDPFYFAGRLKLKI